MRSRVHEEFRMLDGGTNSTLRIKEQEKRLTLNEHDDDDDIIYMAHNIVLL